MKILLIRHGQTPSNLTGAIDTASPGAPLTALGIAQASALGPALMHEGLAAVYCSPLLRAKSTAEILAQHLGLETLIHPGLVEISGGDLEMRADDDATQRYVECMLRWMNRDLSFKIPGGVTGDAFLDTYSAALTSIAVEQGGRGSVAVVTHGASMRVFLALRAGLGVDDTERMWADNTGLAVLESDGLNEWILTQWKPEPLGGAHLRGEDSENIPPSTTKL